MRITADIVGREAGPDEQQVDARWLMAYSAALGETHTPHPLFPVCYEWPATRQPGVLVVFRFVARDAQGEPVSTTDFSALYRDVKLEGGDRSIAPVEDPPRHENALKQAGSIAVAATAAHVYTECARIFNPIHTDVAYARAAGLPDIILHGTATLALSVSRVLEVFGVRTVHRVRCRFAGMVTMPSTLTVFAARQNEEVTFETRNERGEPVIERGGVE